MAATGTSTGTSLSRGAIGLREVLFQSVTSMAPAGAVALSIAAGAAYAGGALPLAVLLALIACLLVATSIGQLAKHLPSAGSIFSYPAEAIHPALGFLVGWVLAFLAIVNSTFANGNAGTLATTRTWYAMSRIGLLPGPPERLPEMKRVVADDVLPSTETVTST